MGAPGPAEAEEAVAASAPVDSVSADLAGAAVVHEVDGADGVDEPAPAVLQAGF